MNGLFLWLARVYDRLGIRIVWKVSNSWDFSLCFDKHIYIMLIVYLVLLTAIYVLCLGQYNYLMWYRDATMICSYCFYRRIDAYNFGQYLCVEMLILLTGTVFEILQDGFFIMILLLWANELVQDQILWHDYVTGLWAMFILFAVLRLDDVYRLVFLCDFCVIWWQILKTM